MNIVLYDISLYRGTMTDADSVFGLGLLCVCGSFWGAVKIICVSHSSLDCGVCQ